FPTRRSSDLVVGGFFVRVQDLLVVLAVDRPDFVALLRSQLQIVLPENGTVEYNAFRAVLAIRRKSRRCYQYAEQIPDDDVTHTLEYTRYLCRSFICAHKVKLAKNL